MIFIQFINDFITKTSVARFRIYIVFSSKEWLDFSCDANGVGKNTIGLLLIIGIWLNFRCDRQGS